MTLADFRELVHATFGPHLEHATPELMRDFISRVYAQLAPPDRTPDGAPSMAAGPMTYEQIVITFFARMLDAPPDQAVILLWLFAGEMYFTQLGEQYNEQFGELLAPKTF